MVGLNNRGSNNYGSAFEKVVYQHLGKYESHDFAEAAKYLATQPYVDAQPDRHHGRELRRLQRTSIPWRCIPTSSASGIANSAVTDWRFYDTIYTERYMDLLANNTAGYDASSGVDERRQAQGAYHGGQLMMDDNVHPQNTMQLLTALTNAGHDVDLRIYPPGRHGAAYNGASFMLLLHTQDAYLQRYLKPAMGTGATR